jgi:peptide/nickel transport system substrate-binding protein
VGYPARISVLLALGLALVLLGPAEVSADRAHRCLVASGTGDLPFVRNFNPFGAPLDFTSGGIYEPLVVVTAAGGGHRYNWLVSRFSWSADRKTLTLTVRPGVHWTDGEPLTSEDIAYTLTAGRQDKQMDQIGLTRAGNEVVSVRAISEDQVAVRLRRIDSMFISSVLANNVRVVPEHVFAHVKNVGGWLNPHPVGTGPFAVVERFGDQSYVLGRNPHYWRTHAPSFACIERVIGSSTESAVLQMVRGEVDLTQAMVPNVRKALVSHDPAHLHYFYPARSPGIGLFLDDSVYPFSVVALRKAISLAIDRKELSAFAEYHYAPTVDALGINRVWPNWISKAAAAEAARLSTYKPQRARQLLLAAGFRYHSGTLVDPRGRPVVINAKVVASWVDWYTDWRLIASNLGQIGIKVNLDAVPDLGAWLSDALSTKTATLLWNTAGDTQSPYDYFKEHLDASSFIPSGRNADSTGNWEHFQSAPATQLLAKFRETTDPATQHRIAGQLEQIWLRTLPFVPLFAAPTWSTYSTRYFVGFPSARNDYVQPDFTDSDYVVALTRIRPRP